VGGDEGLRPGPVEGRIRENIETVVKNLLDAGELPVLIVSVPTEGGHPTVTLNPGISYATARALLEQAFKKLQDDAVPDSQIVSNPDEKPLNERLEEQGRSRGSIERPFG
jgi:hypothetical protein